MCACDEGGGGEKVRKKALMPNICTVQGSSLKTKTVKNGFGAKICLMCEYTVCVNYLKKEPVYMAGVY